MLTKFLIAGKLRNVERICILKKANKYLSLIFEICLISQMLISSASVAQAKGLKIHYVKTCYVVAKRNTWYYDKHLHAIKKQSKIKKNTCFVVKQKVLSKHHNVYYVPNFDHNLRLRAKDFLVFKHRPTENSEHVSVILE